MFCALNGRHPHPPPGQQPAQPGDHRGLAGVAGRAAHHQTAGHGGPAPGPAASRARPDSPGTAMRTVPAQAEAGAIADQDAWRARRSRRPGAPDEHPVGLGRLAAGSPARRSSAGQPVPEPGDRPPPSRAGRPSPADRAARRSASPLTAQRGWRAAPAARASSSSARGRSRRGGPGRRAAWSASRARPHPAGLSPRVQVPVASGQNASSHTAAVSSGRASRPVGLCGLDRHRGPSAVEVGQVTAVQGEVRLVDPARSRARPRRSAMASAPPLVSSSWPGPTPCAAASALGAPPAGRDTGRGRRGGGPRSAPGRARPG